MDTLQTSIVLSAKSRVILDQCSNTFGRVVTQLPSVHNQQVFLDALSILLWPNVLLRDLFHAYAQYIPNNSAWRLEY